MINKRGEKISETFDYIGWRRNKSEMLIVAKRGNKFGFINGQGNVKIPFIYDDFEYRYAYNSSVSDHIVSILQNGKWGFIDIGSSEGNIIVLPCYKSVRTFAFGMAWGNDGTKNVLIDKTGKIVCDGYAVYSDFNPTGLAFVKWKKEDHEAYLINKRGEIVYYCNDDGKGGLTNMRRKK